MMDVVFNPSFKMENFYQIELLIVITLHVN